MRKIERDYIRMSEQCSLNLLEIKQRNGHYALRFESGVVHAAGTPSDRRNRANVLSQLRRLSTV